MNYWPKCFNNPAFYTLLDVDNGGLWDCLSSAKRSERKYLKN